MQTHAKLLKRVFHFLKNPPRPVEGVWNPLECDKTVFLGSQPSAPRSYGCPGGRAVPAPRTPRQEVVLARGRRLQAQKAPLLSRIPAGSKSNASP